MSAIAAFHYHFYRKNEEKSSGLCTGLLAMYLQFAGLEEIVKADVTHVNSTPLGTAIKAHLTSKGKKKKKK